MGQCLLRSPAPLLTVVLSLCLYLSCSAGPPETPEVPPIAGFSKISDRIFKHPAQGYQVQRVEDERGVIKVSIHFTLEPQEPSELKRQTLNALHHLQSSIGKDYRLAVWAYSKATDKLLGMAFYSVLTEEFYFKTAEELE